MVIIRTSAVEVSIQAVSPLLMALAAAAAGGVWAIADTVQPDRIATAPIARRPQRYKDLIYLPSPWSAGLQCGPPPDTGIVRNRRAAWQLAARLCDGVPPARGHCRSKAIFSPSRRYPLLFPLPGCLQPEATKTEGL